MSDEPKEYEYVVPAPYYAPIPNGTIVPDDRRREELRVLRAVEWACSNGVVIRRDQNGCMQALTDSDPRGAFGPWEKRWADAIEGLRAKVEPPKCQCDREQGDSPCPVHGDHECESEGCGKVFVQRSESDRICPECAKVEPAPEPIKTSPIPGVAQASAKGWDKVTVDDAATLAALRECRALGLAYCWDGGTWEVWYADGRPGCWGGDNLPEALAAYKAGQQPPLDKDEEVRGLVDAMHYGNRELMEMHWDNVCLLLGRYGWAPPSIGPECPPPPEVE